MLILSRKKNESLVLNDDITITVIEVRGDKVRLGINCPPFIPVRRQEVDGAIPGAKPPRALSPDETAFVNAILENPQDESIRLVFADWLEERGDPLGEFLRIQCQLAKWPPKDQGWKELKKRERVLWEKHGANWGAFPAAVLWF